MSLLPLAMAVEKRSQFADAGAIDTLDRQPVPEKWLGALQHHVLGA